MLSPELETIDQLLGCDLTLAVIARFYPTFEACKKGVFGLLREGDVVLLDFRFGQIGSFRSYEQ